MVHVGIDMHGTLFPDKTEEIAPHLVEPLREVMHAVRSVGLAKLYPCTGNDLAFVREMIPAQIVAEFDGFVLECGCVVSDGQRSELVLDRDMAVRLREIEAYLRDLDMSEVRYFGNRVAIVSVFSRFVDDDPTSEGSQANLDAVTAAAERAVAKFNLREGVRVIRASVAADIVPNGFSKNSGLQRMALGEATVAIADSLNDWELITEADVAVVPVNAQSNLLAKLQQVEAPNVIKSDKETTEAVIEALRWLRDGRFDALLGNQ